MQRKKYIDKLEKLLVLKRFVVGVKFEKTRTDYKKHQARSLNKPIPYCVAVKSAMSGHRIKIDCFTSGCSGGSRALGLTPATRDYFSGERVVGMGLCKSKKVGSSVAQEVPIGASGTFGVIIQPIECFDEDPDVVLLTANARTVMRIVQGYTYQFGVAKNVLMTGNQAVCMESTINTLKTNGMNVSVLCSGTRHEANWGDDELMVGISYKKFIDVVKGIEETMNAVEPDEHKSRIEEAFRGSSNLEVEVEYGKTYFKRA